LSTNPCWTLSARQPSVPGEPSLLVIKFCYCYPFLLDLSSGHPLFLCVFSPIYAPNSGNILYTFALSFVSLSVCEWWNTISCNYIPLVREWPAGYPVYPPSQHSNTHCPSLQHMEIKSDYVIYEVYRPGHHSTGTLCWSGMN
jgi:hypothetical protein